MPSRPPVRLGVDTPERSLELMRIVTADWFVSLNRVINDKANGNTGEDSDYNERALVRDFFVFLEGFMTTWTHQIDYALELRLGQQYDDRAKELFPVFEKHLDLELNASEIDFIIESRSSNVNASTLKMLIKTIEKVYQHSPRFDFGQGDTWLKIRRLIDRRNGFTHPRNPEDLSLDDHFTCLTAIEEFTAHTRVLSDSGRDRMKTIKEEAPPKV